MSLFGVVEVVMLKFFVLAALGSCTCFHLHMFVSSLLFVLVNNSRSRFLGFGGLQMNYHIISVLYGSHLWGYIYEFRPDSSEPVHLVNT